MNKDVIIALAVGFIMGTSPQWIMANNIDWDEVVKSLTGGGGAGLAALIYFLKTKGGKGEDA